MKYKLLASDMDGTLLNTARIITPRTQAAIHNLLAAGALFVPCTGRSLCAMKDVSALFEEDMPFIVYNGSMAVMHRSREVIFSLTLEAELALEVFAMGEERDLPMVVWCHDQLYINRDYKGTRAYQKAINLTTSKLLVNGEIEELAAKGITKIVWLDYPEKVTAYQQEMQVHFSGRLNCHSSSPVILEFVNIAASKGKALEQIGKRLGIAREEMVAVGDWYNDLSMLQYAGFPVAMDNAPDDIKAVCAHVTYSNANDGVAALIEKYFLQNE